MEEIIPKLQEWLVLYGIRVAAAFFIMFVDWLAARGTRSLVGDCSTAGILMKRWSHFSPASVFLPY